MKLSRKNYSHWKLEEIVDLMAYQDVTGFGGLNLKLRSEASILSQPRQLHITLPSYLSQHDEVSSSRYRSLGVIEIPPESFSPYQKPERPTVTSKPSSGKAARGSRYQTILAAADKQRQHSKTNSFNFRGRNTGPRDKYLSRYFFDREFVSDSFSFLDFRIPP